MARTGTPGAAVGPAVTDTVGTRLEWAIKAQIRRGVFFALAVGPAIFATHLLLHALGPARPTWLSVSLAAIFFVLYAWTASGFWIAVAGFGKLLGGSDGWAPQPAGSTTPLPRVAIVMPVRNENMQRVYAGLFAVLNSVRKTGEGASFDLFLLSDSDNPDRWIAEEWAVVKLRQSVARGARVFYRRRKLNLKAKSGNIADFLRRWGRHYRYMLVLDADSIMSGDALVSLTRRMEENPSLGIIQTSPVLVNRWSMFARMQQFASGFYGPLFAAGLRFWQLGDGHYIGHNAMVRVDAFMQNCALPSLPGTPPLGGHILSHDFVEAALMRRAGYGVWLDYETPGSYEENPSNILEDLARDRRWCQGNLQHLRLLFVRGLSSAHRLLFIHGALSYLSSPLWLLFMGLSLDAGLLAEQTPTYFRSDQFFPVWPVSHSFLLVRLLASTATMLLAPRIFSFVLHARTAQQRRAFGGTVRAGLSILVELVLSTLLAPIRMWFHTRFVSATIRGRKTGWKSPDRQEEGLSLQDVFDAYGLVSAVAAACGFFIFRVSPILALWLSPILMGLVLAAPLSWLTSDPKWGRLLARTRLFETPDETHPSHVLLLLREGMLQAVKDRRLEAGFVEALADPFLYQLHRGQLRERDAPVPLDICDRAARYGPLALSIADRKRILSNRALLDAIHSAIWASPETPFQRWQTSEYTSTAKLHT